MYTVRMLRVLVHLARRCCRAAALAGVLVASLQQAAGAQQRDSTRAPAARARFIGTVASIKTTQPVEHADVRLVFIDSMHKTRENANDVGEMFVDSTRSRVGITDAAGTFAIRNVEPGHYLLTVRRIGFEPFEGVLTIDTATVEMELALTQLMTVLPPVRITESAVNKVTERLDRVGFKWRSKAGQGTSIDRAEILRRKPVHVTDILEQYGVHDGATLMLDRMETDWQLLRDYPADLVIGIEIFRKQAALPMEFGMTRRTGLSMGPNGSGGMAPQTVLIWTFIP